MGESTISMKKELVLSSASLTGPELWLTVDLIDPCRQPYYYVAKLFHDWLFQRLQRFA